MNIKKIEKQLRKINQLFETIKEDGTMSAIERDLLLSYVRTLYEKIVLKENSDHKDESPATSQKEATNEAPKAEEKVNPTNALADVVMKEVVEAAPATSTASETVSSVDTAPPAQHVIEETKPEVPAEILNLFEFEEVSELSDKLSRAPIADLTKSMGINERIFTVQELFGGDSELFTRSMETMNKFTSLEQARDYLVKNVAVDQKWADENKVKKATHFIKLVSRRY